MKANVRAEVLDELFCTDASDGWGGAVRSEPLRADVRAVVNGLVEEKGAYVRLDPTRARGRGRAAEAMKRGTPLDVCG